MPVKIACPSCKAGLSMPETMFGKQVRCPKCSQPFQCPDGAAEVTAAPAPAPARPTGGGAFDFEPGAGGGHDALDFEGGATARTSAYLGTGAWARVRSAALWLFISAGCFYIAFLIILIPPLLHDPTQPPSGSPGSGKTLMAIFMVLILTGVLTAAIAQGKCSAAPGASGSRGAAQTALALSALSAICGTVVTAVFLLVLFEKAQFLPPSIAKILPLLTLGYIGTLFGSFIAFMFFLALAGANLSSRKLMSNTIAFALFFNLSPMIYFFFFASRELLRDSLGLLGREAPGKFLVLWLPLILVTALVAWFFLLVLTLLGAIARAARNAG